MLIIKEETLGDSMVFDQQKTTLLGSETPIIWEDADYDGKDQEVARSEFAELFEENYANLDEIKVGKIIAGKVTQISGDYVIVDIGHKTDGEIPTYEFFSKEEESEEDVNASKKRQLLVQPGDTIDVFLESFENRDGQLVLSYEKAQEVKSWNRLGEAFEQEEIVVGKIVRRVKGGLHVDVGVRAFLPGSQIDLRPVKNLDEFVGQSFDFKIIKFNKSRANVVLSRRILLESDRAKVREKTISHLKEGLELKGIVKNLTNYGAFVDLGGVDGLLHITDMSWGRVSHPSQVFDIGQEIEVVILSYNAESMRISLGHKQLQEDPWSHAIHKYDVGSRNTGVVVSLTDYGAFVELEEGIEGLIHISEMSWLKRIRHPSKLVSIGDEVEVLVLGVDAEAKRISLGMKQLEANPWDMVSEKYQVGDIISGKIRNITDFGLFVAIEEGIDALVHISDISWTERTRRCVDDYYKGQEIQAKVLQIDVEGEKFSLGIKQLQEDPWNAVLEKYVVGSQHVGVISKVINFGVFVKIPEGFEGLVHISELSSDLTQKRLNEAVSPGDEMNFLVLSLDSAGRKISLSQKALELGLEGDALQEYINSDKNQPISRDKFVDNSSQSDDTTSKESVEATVSEVVDDALPSSSTSSDHVASADAPSLESESAAEESGASGHGQEDKTSEDIDFEQNVKEDVPVDELNSSDLEANVPLDGEEKSQGTTENNEDAKDLS